MILWWNEMKWDKRILVRWKKAFHIILKMATTLSFLSPTLSRQTSLFTQNPLSFRTQFFPFSCVSFPSISPAALQNHGRILPCSINPTFSTNPTQYEVIHWYSFRKVAPINILGKLGNCKFLQFLFFTVTPIRRNNVSYTNWCTINFPAFFPNIKVASQILSEVLVFDWYEFMVDAWMQFSDDSSEVELRLELGEENISPGEVYVDATEKSLVIRVQSSGYTKTLLDTHNLYGMIKPSEMIW